MKSLQIQGSDENSVKLVLYRLGNTSARLLLKQNSDVLIGPIFTMSRTRYTGTKYFVLRTRGRLYCTMHPDVPDLVHLDGSNVCFQGRISPLFDPHLYLVEHRLPRYAIHVGMFPLNKIPFSIDY